MRLGTILGARLSPLFSLGLGLDIDVLNVDNSEVDVTAVMFGISIVPSFHFPITAGEFILSPKLGFLAYSETAEGYDIEGSGSGWVAGVSATMAFQTSSVRLGPMLALERQHIT